MSLRVLISHNTDSRRNQMSKRQGNEITPDKRSLNIAGSTAYTVSDAVHTSLTSVV